MDQMAAARMDQFQTGGDTGFGSEALGHGHGLADARPSIELVHRIRTTTLGGDGPRHPVLAQLGRSA
jgi:hypothetical protein